MEPDDSAALIRLLVSIATHQHTINEDLRAWIAEHRAIHEDLQEMNKQQVAINDRLARMIPPSPNGHEEASMRPMARAWTAILLLALLLAGCAATVPLASPALDEATKQFPPLHAQAELYLVRLPQHLGTRTIFPLHVDGVLVGGLAPGTYLKRTLTPGTHTVHALTAENQASLQLTVQAGQRVFVRVAPKDWGMVVRVDLVRLDEMAEREAVMQTAMSADSD